MQKPAVFNEKEYLLMMYLDLYCHHVHRPDDQKALCDAARKTFDDKFGEGSLDYHLNLVAYYALLGEPIEKALR